MKYLLVILVVLVGAVAWAWRRRRSVERRPPPPKAASAALQPMVACAHCGVHLPQGDAPFDAAGRPYCSDAHRRAGPRA